MALLVLSFVVVWGLMFVLNYLTPLYFDDFRYIYSWQTGERITSVTQIFPSMFAHYQTMNGRIPVHFLAQVFLLINPTIFDLINSFAFSLFVLLICYYAVGSLKNISATVFSLAFFLIWIVTPDFGESYLWLTGSANYLFGPLIALSFLIPYIKFFNGSFNIEKVLVKGLFLIAYLIWGILAGWTNENISLCLIITQILFIISSAVTKKKIMLWMFGGVMGNIIGSVLLFSSPSYLKRSSIWSGSADIYSMLKNFFLNVSNFFNSSFLIMVLIICIITILIFKTKNFCIENHIISIVFLLSSIAFICSTIACDYFPGRAWTSCTAMLCIVFLNVLQELNLNALFRKASYFAALLCFLIFFFGSYANVFFELKSVDYAFNEREAQISQYHHLQKEEIKLKPIKSHNKYSCYVNGGDIAEDYWNNHILEKYYNIKIIVDE